jgi:hypothetical protein
MQASMEIRCNICDEIINSLAVEQHVTGRSHEIKKRVADFNEMNVQIKSYQHDTSVVKTWLRDLYNYDFLSTGRM